ncbi:MAG: rRNA pseudouridine synthase [Fibrobacter sp.]|nr:rRNA pseudouridine synthase [Fibrobacter sp.]
MAFNSHNNFSKRPQQGKPSFGKPANKFSGGAHGVARVISKRGYCSRSKAEMLVREGRVTLNGRIIKDPETPARESDEIIINGKRIEANSKMYFMMNKPRGVVTTANDEKGRATVMEVFAEQYRKLFPGKEPPHISPVGRLDAASEGLLLFSNDTEWANSILEPKETSASIASPSARNDMQDERCTNPRVCIAESQLSCALRNDSAPASNDSTQARGDIHKKIYRVQTKGKPTTDDLKKMEEGFAVPPRVFGEPEEFMHAKRAVIHAEGEKNCWLEITLTEGKNREIRRMLAHLGYEVLRLVRIQIDDFVLGDLKPGCIKPIQP